MESAPYFRNSLDNSQLENSHEYVRRNLSKPDITNKRNKHEVLEAEHSNDSSGSGMPAIFAFLSLRSGRFIGLQIYYCCKSMKQAWCCHE